MADPLQLKLAGSLHAPTVGQHSIGFTHTTWLGAPVQWQGACGGGGSASTDASSVGTSVEASITLPSAAASGTSSEGAVSIDTSPLQAERNVVIAIATAHRGVDMIVEYQRDPRERT